jgi:hypothetical protein
MASARQPPPMFGLCPRCGWYGQAGGHAASMMVKLEGREPTNDGIHFYCPRCGQLTARVQPRERIRRDLAAVLRESGLTRQDIQDLRDALSDDAGLSPRALAERVPKATGLINHAVRAHGSRDWLMVLLTIVGLLAAIATAQFTHEQSETAKRAVDTAHRDAEEARRDAAAQREPLQLSDEDLAKITAAVEARLHPAEQPDHAHRQHHEK